MGRPPSLFLALTLSRQKHHFGKSFQGRRPLTGWSCPGLEFFLWLIRKWERCLHEKAAKTIRVIDLSKPSKYILTFSCKARYSTENKLGSNKTQVTLRGISAVFILLRLCSVFIGSDKIQSPHRLIFFYILQSHYLYKLG